MRLNFRNLLILTMLLLTMTACSVRPLLLAQPAQSSGPGFVRENDDIVGNLAAWDVPHTHLTMLLPKGWVTEYFQGDITIASNSKNFFYNPAEPFDGVLINMFVSDGPRAVGPSFDVMKLATDFVGDQRNVIQSPSQIELDGRQIVTTLYENEDSKGMLITYLAGFVVEEQQLTVFLAATPSESRGSYLPILTKILHSIQIRSTL